MLTIAFTGRRPKDLCFYSRDKYIHMFKQLVSYLKQFVDKDDCVFINGMAQGFDQLAGHAVNVLKGLNPAHSVTNVAFVPFDGQSRVWSKTGFQGQQQYQALLDSMDRVNILYKPDLNNYSEIAQALLNRNAAMVDAADIVIALYPDDTWKSVSNSGTANCMKVAASKGKRIYQLQYIKSDKYGLHLTNVVRHN